MFDRPAEFPGLLRHEVGIAGVDAVGGSSAELMKS